MANDRIVEMGVVREDLGYHEDPKAPGTGARYWLIGFKDTELFLADPSNRDLVVGGVEKIVKRPGSPALFIWERKPSKLVFNPPVDHEAQRAKAKSRSS